LHEASHTYIGAIQNDHEEPSNGYKPNKEEKEDEKMSNMVLFGSANDNTCSSEGGRGGLSNIAHFV